MPAITPSSPDINASVMASAGTGKTYLLVDRLLRLLLSGARADGILAITFTRKAAAEMQQRLSQRLFDLAASDDTTLHQQLSNLGLTPTTELLNQARSLYESLLHGSQGVRCTTFHAFCQGILLRFPLEADTPPGFELLENPAEPLRTARDRLLAEASAAPDGELANALQKLLDYCGSLNGIETALNSFIAHRGDWLAYTEGQSEPLEFARHQLKSMLRINPDSDPLAEFFNAQRLSELAEFAELLDRHPTKTNTGHAEDIRFACAPEAKYEERFEACRRAFLTEKNQPRARKASDTQAKKMGAEGEARFLELHEQLAQALLDTHEQQLALSAWQAGNAWYLAGNCLLQHFQHIKREQRQLDFNDLEWNTYRLLNHADNAQWVQYKLDQRIDHLLVDEFQDTNPTQWRLLLPLLEELAAGESNRQRSVFLVGDSKQSIYRFRRAEPRLFHTANHWLDEHLQAQRFPLHKSWRSSPAIMGCVNQVFADGGPLAGMVDDFTSHSTHHEQLWGEVSVLPLAVHKAKDDSEPTTQELRNPLEQPRDEEESSRYLLEGRQIATEIQRLFKSGVNITQKDTTRPLRYGDVMILVRKRAPVKYYEQALRDAGIPYLGADRGTLLHSIEVNDMLSLLEVLLTPQNNLALATVLRSPLFDCSDADLIRLAQHGKGDWYQRLQELGAELDNTSPLAEAARLLQRWHQLAGILPIHDLLDRIFHEGDLLNRYQAAFPAHTAKRVQNNLARFLELALEIDSGRYPSLGHFLARLAALKESPDEAPDEAADNSESDRVTLLTIHAAKGLEAPVVFIADATHTAPGARAYTTLVNWQPDAPAPQNFLLNGRKEQSPEALRQLLQQEQQLQERESANLLYVALTRARQLLFITGTHPGRGSDTGWYGIIRAALDPDDAVDGQETLRLTYGKPEQATRQKEATKPKKSIKPDPRLSQPLTDVQLLYEIAPSRLDSGYSAAEGDEDGLLRGIICHRLLQLLSETHSSDHARIRQQIAAENSIEINSPLLMECYSECNDMLEDKSLATVFRPATGIEAINEAPLLYTQGEKTVHGVIDRLLVGAKEIWIVDYKTHRSANKDNINELAEHYRQQIEYYIQGIQRLWPQHAVRGFLLFTAPRLLQEVRLRN